MSANAGSREKLAADLKRVVRDSEELLQSSAGLVGEKAHALREILARRLESAKTTYRRLEARAKEGAKATDRVIRDNPYQTIGVAFGLGLLLGLVVRRK
jgi:ElaB/YqjD/DUF883 family membrane-anchored ribosome-binding protein